MQWDYRFESTLAKFKTCNSLIVSIPSRVVRSSTKKKSNDLMPGLQPHPGLTSPCPLASGGLLHLFPWWLIGELPPSSAFQPRHPFLSSIGCFFRLMAASLSCFLPSSASQPLSQSNWFSASYQLTLDAKPSSSVWSTSFYHSCWWSTSQLQLQTYLLCLFTP